MENKGPEPVTSPPPDLPECQWTAVNGTMNPHKCPLTTHARPPAHPSYGWMRGRDDTTKTSTTKTTTRDVWSPTLFSFHQSAPLGLQYALNSWPIPRSTGNFKKLISQSHTSTHFPAGRGVERGWRVNGGEGGAGMASMGADESSSSSMTIATHSKSMHAVSGDWRTRISISMKESKAPDAEADTEINTSQILCPLHYWLK